MFACLRKALAWRFMVRPAGRLPDHLSGELLKDLGLSRSDLLAIASGSLVRDHTRRQR